MTEGVFSLAGTVERLAFEIYLRTGRHVPAGQIAAEIELKFNPWHDPEDGRFTFSGRGEYSSGGGRSGGSGGGSGAGGSWKSKGGSFGGGGASGGWKPSPKALPKKAQPPKRLPKAIVRTDRKPDLVAEPIKHDGPPPPPKKKTLKGSAVAATTTKSKHIKHNGYDYEVDTTVKRNLRTQGYLQSGPIEPRSKRLQKEAGGADRLSTDDGGHYIAPRFGGAREDFNHFPQDASFNRGEYRAFEDKLAEIRDEGHRVHIDIISRYHGASRRPFELHVIWTVDGKESSRRFSNEKKGK